MNQQPVRASDLATGLRNVRRGGLALLAVCALVIATTANPGSGPAPNGFPIAAIALGLCSVLARHAAVATQGRARILFALASPLLAAGIGLVGVVLALQDGPRTTALVYVLGGVLLSLRPALGPVRR